MTLENPDQERDKESPEQTEKILSELSAIERAAEVLAKNIEQSGAIKSTEVVQEVMQEIEDKYINLVGWINTTALPFAAGEVGILLQDVVDPNKWLSGSYPILENIDWSDIATRGFKYAAVTGAIYALARCGAIILEWKRKANVADTLSGAFSNRLSNGHEQ